MNCNILKDDKGFLKEDNKGRGRYDLIEPHFIQRLYTASKDNVLVGSAAHRMALRLEHGAEKYEPDNWKRGNKEAFDRSVFRHAMKALRGLTDEDHLGACITTLMFRHFLCEGTDHTFEGQCKRTKEERELAITIAWNHFFKQWDAYKKARTGSDEEEGAVIRLAEQVGFLILVENRILEDKCLEDKERAGKDSIEVPTETVADAGHYHNVSRLI